MLAFSVFEWGYSGVVVPSAVDKAPKPFWVDHGVRNNDVGDVVAEGVLAGLL